MIMVQFEDSLRPRSEVKISIRSSYSEKIFYEKKKFDDLWAHYHSIALPPQYCTPNHLIPIELGLEKKKARSSYSEKIFFKLKEMKDFLPPILRSRTSRYLLSQLKTKKEDKVFVP
jgi:hypothetical protein